MGVKERGIQGVCYKGLGGEVMEVFSGVICPQLEEKEQNENCLEGTRPVDSFLSPLFHKHTRFFLLLPQVFGIHSTSRNTDHILQSSVHVLYKHDLLLPN